jgi:hypothetical protein
MTSTWRRVIGGIEIVGGVSGVAILSWEMSQVQINPILLLLALFLYSLYLLSFVAGVLLWRDHKWGRIASIIVQAAQLPKIFTPIIIFNICFGLDIYPHLFVGTQGFFTIGVDMKILSFHQFHINAPFPGVALGVSIPACIFLTALIKNRKEGALDGRFYVPPPTDPRYWSAPTASDTTQDQLERQSSPIDKAATNNPDDKN